MPAALEPAVIDIRPTGRWKPLRLGELWRYRELMMFLAWRDIKVRYKQTALGVCWAVLQPLLAMLIFTVFFGRFARLPSDGLPYPLFAFCGLLPWQMFSNSLSESGGSLVANRNLITKVYFPRLVIPMAPVIAGLVDFLISFVILIGMMAWYRITPGPRILLVPFFVLLAATTAMSAGIWLSALNVRYRDVRYVIPFLTQFWLYATPIAYSIALVPPRWRPWLALNPMVGVVEGFRWSILGTGSDPGTSLWISLGVVAVLLMSGLYYFRRMESSFADIV